MSEKKVILIDMDSTIVDMFPNWLGEYNELTGDNLKVEDLTTWHTHNHARHGHRIYEPLRRSGFFTSLEPMPGAIEALRHMHEHGHDIVITSAAAFPLNFSEKVLWIHENLPWVPHVNIALFGRKELISGDVFIDDGPHNAAAYIKAHPKAFITGILHPYNEKSHRFFTLLAHDWKNPAKAWKTIEDCVLEHLETT
jgi:5'(3')-deoxyribonucleotidase